MAAARFPFVRAGFAVCLSLLAADALSPAWAGGPDPEGRSTEVWMAVSNHTLDHMRGGFDIGNGLLVSFGISRVVYINGNLVTQTTVDFGQLNNMSAAQAAQLSKQLQNLNVIQNGPNNTFESQPGGVTAGTIIQNTLNNQQITNQTVINATSNGAGMMRSLDLLSTLNDSPNSIIGH